jgi:hypothetical protein
MHQFWCEWENEMYAHLFKNPKRDGGGWQLVITGEGFVEDIREELVFATKREAKAYAVSVNAMPWNY